MERFLRSMLTITAVDLIRLPSGCVADVFHALTRHFRSAQVGFDAFRDLDG